MTEEEALAKLLPRQPEAPHAALIWISADVQQVTSYGELSGDPVHTKPRFALRLNGTSRDACIKRLNELIELIQEKCA